jgi:DNA-binding CsgD family transcriptional regulator
VVRARDAAFIRKLCNLALPPRALVLSLLPALRAIVPAHSAGLFWVDAAGQMSSLYAERLLPPDAMAAYYERHYASQRDGFADAFRRRAAAADPVSWHSFTTDERASAYFRDVLAPLDAYHVLYAVLKDARDGRRAFAQLSLYRGAGDRSFGPADADILRGLLRYLSGGLADLEFATGPVDESIVAEEELGLLTARGEVSSASDAWRRLVRLCALSRVAPSEALREHGAIENFLREVCGSAATLDGGRVDIVRSTAWGRFTLRAFRLADPRGRRGGQVGLLIRREEPKLLSLVRGAGHSSLSPQQCEVALLLARGFTNPEIAGRLGLTLNTASYHVKQVYTKLEVNDRDAVGGRLLRLAHAAVAA